MNALTQSVGATLKSLVPATVKRGFKNLLCQRSLWRPLRAVARTPVGQVPSRQALVDLIHGWNNELYSADVDYLEEVARRAVGTPGPILECGTGVSTIVLGLLAGRRGVETWSLEHSPDWHDRVSMTLKWNRVPGVRLCLTPLRAFGGYSWYDAPLATLPGRFSLVICDGPPGDTPGGRFGLMPVVGQRLPTGPIILLDDAHRVGEEQVMDQWARDRTMTVRVTPGGEKAFATVSL